MRWLALYITVGLGVLATPVQAEDSVEAARTSLEKAQKTYLETVARAKVDLQAAGERELKKLRASNKQNVAEQIARIEKIEDQLQEFSAHSKLPTDATLRDAVDRYRESLSKARQKTEKVFDALAQRYIAAKDDSNAKSILEEKTAFFQRANLTGMYEITTNPPFGHATLELTIDGNFKQVQNERAFTGTWSLTSEKELLLKYVSDHFGTVTLSIVDNQHLTGVNVHPDGQKWGWRVIRQSAATFRPGEFTLVIDSGKDLWTYSFHDDGTCSSVSPDEKFRGAGNWWQFNNEIHYELTSQGSYGGVYGNGILKIVDNDHLSGKNFQDNRTWQWALVRKQTDAPTQK